MRSRLTYGTLAIGALALLMYTVPAVAHHAFGAEFDANAPLRIQGNIVRLEWVNPHSWIHLEVSMMVAGTDTIMPTGSEREVWMIEGGTPNVLVRRGLRRECLPIGTELVVDGYQTKDRRLKRANGRDVTFPDGRQFFMGSSGTGAPDDGAEAHGRGAARC